MGEAGDRSAAWSDADRCADCEAAGGGGDLVGESKAYHPPSLKSFGRAGEKHEKHEKGRKQRIGWPG